jgi:hypothetical protein
LFAESDIFGGEVISWFPQEVGLMCFADLAAKLRNSTVSTAAVPAL